MFENVFELPPGHSMMVTRKGQRIAPYWRLEPQDGDVRHSEAYEAELEALLADAVRLRLRSDVPVGAYLSGGLDSTMTAALVKEQVGGRLRTFSLTFSDAEFDERDFQTLAVQQLGVEHEALSCEQKDICDVFPSVIWHTEKPVLRTAPAPLYLLSKLVRENGFKVVITGEGADEVLGGYEHL